MNKELHNRIHDELKGFLNREPNENEIMNSQTDYNIMAKVKDRLHTEEIGVMQDQIDSLTSQVETINTKTDTAIKSMVK